MAQPCYPLVPWSLCSLEATVGDNLSDCEPVVGITSVFYFSGTLYNLQIGATQSQNPVLRVCLSSPMKWSEVAQLCPPCSDPMDCSLLLHPWDFPGKSTGVGCHFLLQGIFPTQGSNPGLLHCRQTLHRLSHQGSSCPIPGTNYFLGQSHSSKHSSHVRPNDSLKQD